MSELDVVTAFEEAVAARRPVVLATIVRAKGSTPRGVGSRMAIEPGRAAVGTIAARVGLGFHGGVDLCPAE